MHVFVFVFLFVFYLFLLRILKRFSSVLLCFALLSSFLLPCAFSLVRGSNCNGKKGVGVVVCEGGGRIRKKETGEGNICESKFPIKLD